MAEQNLQTNNSPAEEASPNQAGVGSKISNTEWGLVIGAAVMIDLIQVGLEWLVIGLAINPFIDIFVGMTLAFYFWVRGVKMDEKKILALLGAFLGEMLPIIDEFPLWTGDVLATMVLDKADKILRSNPLVGKVVSSVSTTNRSI